MRHSHAFITSRVGGGSRLKGQRATQDIASLLPSDFCDVTFGGKQDIGLTNVQLIFCLCFLRNLAKAERGCGVFLSDKSLFNKNQDLLNYKGIQVQQLEITH